MDTHNTRSRRLLQAAAGLVPAGLREAIRARLATEFRSNIKPELKEEVKSELRPELKEEIKAELSQELKALLPSFVGAFVQHQFEFRATSGPFAEQIRSELRQAEDEGARQAAAERLAAEWRRRVRIAAGLPAEIPGTPTIADLLQEFRFLRGNQTIVESVFRSLYAKRVLYAGQAYYNTWYLSRALRHRGWKADVLNWDTNPGTQIYYHGEDFHFGEEGLRSLEERLAFYLSALYAYDIFHFSNAHGITFDFLVQALFQREFGWHSEIELLKGLGKKIVYSNNGCLDGVSQSAFSRWGPESVCAICRWKDEPSVCSDARNLEWGKFRNSVADYQCLLGGNRVDFNEDPRIHEVPQFYCLDRNLWHPQIEIPEAFRLPPRPLGTVWLYHAVGHRADRTKEGGVNIKSSHVYLPLVEKLKEQGLLLELLEPTGIPNRDVRFLQAQADVFLDMLTYGWFGANAREAMMLGKPVICFIRPDWLESVREEIPDYAAELPIISATPETIEDVLRDLIANPQKRQDAGARGRAFAVKWHSAEVAGSRFDEIYSKLLQGDPLLRIPSRPSVHG